VGKIGGEKRRVIGLGKWGKGNEQTRQSEDKQEVFLQLNCRIGEDGEKEGKGERLNIAQCN